MEMHQVRYFLAVARTLNFTRAADECNVTQPSLTRAIQKLEDELGGLLFRRERSLTHLTDLGRLMQPHLERIYDAAEAAKALAKGIGKAQVAPLSLGVAYSADTEALLDIIHEVSSSLPGFALTIENGTSADLLNRALKGDIELLLIEAPDDAPERLEAWRLFEQRYRMVTRRGHPLDNRSDVSLAELTEEAWVDCGSDGAIRLRTASAAAGFTPTFRHWAGQPSQVARLLAAGLGSAILPGAAQDERMVALALLDDAFLAPVVLAGIAGRRRSAAADAFVRAARARAWADR